MNFSQKYMGSVFFFFFFFGGGHPVYLIFIIKKNCKQYFFFIFEGGLIFLSRGIYIYIERESFNYCYALFISKFDIDYLFAHSWIVTSIVMIK